MKLRVAWRNIVNYVRHDLKEIAFPSSLPDPPSAKPKPRKLKPYEYYHVWKTATKLYIESWRTGTIDEEEEEEDKKESNQSKKGSPEEMSVLEELAIAARAGSENMRPALQRVYMTRASAYRDALRSFVQGYQEGLREVIATSEALKNDIKVGESYSPNESTRHQPDVHSQSDSEVIKDQSQVRGS